MFRSASALLVLPAFVLITACAGDPLANIPRLDEVNVAGPAPIVEAVEAPGESDENAGLFQRLLRQRQVTPDEAATPAPAAPATSATSAAQEAAPVTAGADNASSTEAPKKRGWFFGRRDDAPKAEETVKTAVLDGGATAEDGVELASLETAPARKSTARGGLFGGMNGAQTSASGQREAMPGEVLPYGEIARACHAKGTKLGQQVAKYPERGAKYRVYDSAPGHVGLHSFFITGFADGCPRQFTAALAVFGSPGMYEALRYGLPVKARSKKPTDIAYEKVKSRKCGVGRTKPCGAKISRLEKTTVFLSLYNRFEGAQGWTNLLLSDGKVMALDSQG